MYARRQKGEVLDFGHRGWLYEESFLFYDYKTDSLWVQATGEAVHGAFKGSRLERLPATQTTWSQWRRLHPQTRVLGRPVRETLDHWLDSYEHYYQTGKGVKYQRHAPLHFGLAVITSGGRKLYPFRALKKKSLLVDRVGGEPVLVVFHAASRTAVAFDPRHRGRTLDFGAPQVENTDLLLVDRSSGDTWCGLTGRCLKGAAKGEELRQLITTQFVVENWPLHYPRAPVYPAP